MYEICVISFSIAFIMYVLHFTSVVEEYFELFRIKSFYYQEYLNFMVSPYYSQNLKNQINDYKDYLKYRRNNFLTRLIFCPYCLGFWLSAIVTTLLEIPYMTFSVAFLSCISYFVLSKLSK